MLGYLLAELVNTVHSGEDQREKIDRKVEQLKDDVDNIPSPGDATPAPIPTIVIPPMQPGPPGQPGQPGRPGPVVTVPPRTVVVTTPGPTRTVTASPAPATPQPCKLPLLGTCLARGEGKN